MHGFWTSPATLNTVAQLNKERPNLASLLREQLRNALITVVGYAGWSDGFMKSLRERAADMSMLGSDVLWCAYARSPEVVLGNPDLKRFYGTPNFTLYCGVDGNRLFGNPETFPRPSRVPPRASLGPSGYTVVTPELAKQSVYWGRVHPRRAAVMG